MAIVVEEEKDRGGVVVLIGWLVVIITIVLAAYLIFFKNPQIIEKVGPANFRQTAQVAQINPKLDVFQNPLFTVRQEYGRYIQVPGEGTVGKANPFLP